MRIISFAGKAGSGKTTAALHAIEKFGGTKIALGDAVKKEVAEFLTQCGAEFEHRHLYGTQADKDEHVIVHVDDWIKTPLQARIVINRHTIKADKLISITYRKLMQMWGTEYRRAQNPAYWCNRAAEKIHRAEGLVFLDDVRFADEAEMVIKLGGMVVRIDRPGGPRVSNPAHESETALDNYEHYHWMILNNGSLDEYKAEVERMLRLCL